MPCNDVEGQSHDEVEQVVDTGGFDNQQDHDHEDKDDCSPFCQCNCCSVHVITYLFETQELTDIPEINSQISSYINPFYDGYDGSILQPPQLNS